MKYNIKTIYVAGGCFWEIEAYISRLKGVIQTEVGYANGITHDPKDAKSILRLVNKNPSIEAHELKGFYLAENKYQKYLEKHPEINSNIKIKMNQSDNLTLLSYQVTKLAMNEEAFSGKYADFDEEGTYVDITNNEELFSSKDKIKNDSGYACFTKPINPDAITSLRDFSYGMVRLEIRAQKSGIHLGYKKKRLL